MLRKCPNCATRQSLWFNLFLAISGEQRCPHCRKTIVLNGSWHVVAALAAYSAYVFGIAGMVMSRHPMPYVGLIVATMVGYFLVKLVLPRRRRRWWG